LHCTVNNSILNAPVNEIQHWFQFWRELRLERQWKDSGPSAGGDFEGRKDELYQLRDKSASFGNDLSVSPPPRPTTCLGIENSCNRMKTRKKLRITESRDDVRAVDSCDETSQNSMESMKENTVCEAEASGGGEEHRETRTEVQKRRLSNQNQDYVHIDGQNGMKANDALQSVSNTLCVSNGGVNSVPQKEENQRQGGGCSEGWNDEAGSSCQDGRTGHGNNINEVEGLKENGPESSGQEILPHKPYSDAADWRGHHVAHDDVECDTRPDGSILRVKGGGYGSPSDNLTDALHGIEEICKVHRHKNSIASIESAVSAHKERGRLDKSYSTPAYDLTDCDQISDRSGMMYLVEDRTNCHLPDSSSSLPSPTSEISTRSVFETEKQSHQVSETEAPCKAVSNRNSECSDVASQDGDSYSLEDKQTQRIGEILETINVALLQHHLKEHSNDIKISNSSNQIARADLSSQRSDDVTLDKDKTESNTQLYVPSNECIGPQSVAYAPSRQERKSEISAESNVAGSLQEPELLHSSRDLAAAQRESEVWQKMPMPEISVKQPHTEEKQQSVACIPQTCASHITICVTPPEPPPRPDHPKGGVGMGYRAIMAARSLGRNASNKSSVGGGHATFPSPRSLRKRNPLLTSKCTWRFISSQYSDDPLLGMQCFSESTVTTHVTHVDFILVLLEMTNRSCIL
jgi:hypothetical protein